MNTDPLESITVAKIIEAAVLEGEKIYYQHPEFSDKSDNHMKKLRRILRETIDDELRWGLHPAMRRKWLDVLHRSLFKHICRLAVADVLYRIRMNKLKL